MHSLMRQMKRSKTVHTPRQLLAGLNISDSSQLPKDKSAQSAECHEIAGYTRVMRSWGNHNILSVPCTVQSMVRFRVQLYITPFAVSHRTLLDDVQWTLLTVRPDTELS